MYTIFLSGKITTEFILIYMVFNMFKRFPNYAKKLLEVSRVIRFYCQTIIFDNDLYTNLLQIKFIVQLFIISFKIKNCIITVVIIVLYYLI